MKDARQVSFTRMADGTAEDYALLDEIAKPYIAASLLAPYVARHTT